MLFLLQPARASAGGCAAASRRGAAAATSRCALPVARARAAVWSEHWRSRPTGCSSSSATSRARCMTSCAAATSTAGTSRSRRPARLHADAGGGRGARSGRQLVRFRFWPRLSRGAAADRRPACALASRAARRARPLPRRGHRRRPLAARRRCARARRREPRVALVAPRRSAPTVEALEPAGRRTRPARTTVHGCPHPAVDGARTARACTLLDRRRSSRERSR